MCSSKELLTSILALLGSGVWATPLDPAVAQSLKSARDAASASANLIYQRFEFATPRVQFLLVSNNMPATAWDVLKYKVAKKFLEGNATFLMTFGGSSVTAGHDNFYNEAYPFVVERRLRGAFEALGINLQVHNIAHGASNCRPSNLCYEAMGGDNPDWIGWEQSFNCGRDGGIFEIMARTAFWAKGIVHYMASGGFIPGHCPASNDTIPWISEKWSPENETLLQGVSPYAPNHTAVLAFRRQIDAFFQESPAVSRFIGGVKQYTSVGAYGNSVWNKSPKLCQNDLKGGTGCDALQIMGDCIGRFGGNHWMTKEAAAYHNPSGHGAGHHPPAGMHLQRGEFIAYNLLHVVLDAIYTLENDLQSKSKEDLLKEYHTSLSKIQDVPMPNATSCGPECNTRALCYTDFQPNFNPKYLLENVIISGAGNDAHKSWRKEVRKPAGADAQGYRDFKVLYEAHGANISLHLKIHIGQADYLRVCGYSAKDAMKRALFYLDANISNPAASYTPSDRVQLIATRRYVNDECTLLQSLPRGDHVLTIKTKPEGGSAFFSHSIMYE